MINPDQFELHRWVPRLRWTAARAAFLLFPRLATCVLEISAAGLRSGQIPHLFSQDLRQIHPSLNDDLLDLFGRCERTLRNQFTFQAESESFGEAIEWERHRSEAWRTELHAFDYGLELAVNFRISGDDRYARHLRYLVADWVASNPPGQGTGWKLAPLARRVRNWILAADLARQDWELDAGFCELMAHSLALQVTMLRQHSQSMTGSDEALDAARALHLAGAFFAGRKGNELGLEGRAIVLEHLKQTFTAEGRYSESRPSSQIQFARTIVEFLVFRAKGEPDDPSLEESLYEILKVIEGSLLPDGTLPQFGRAPAPSTEELADLFGLAAVQLNEPSWKDIAGKFGVFPYLILGESGKAHFDQLPEFPWEPARCFQPHCGLFRLSVSADSAMVINGRLPSSPQDHQDALSYELALRGQRAIVDSGVFDRDKNSRAPYFASAQAHNVLLVDGVGAHWTAPEESLPNAEIVWQQEERTIGLRAEQPGFLPAGLRHLRAWFCLDGQAWVVLDAVSGAGIHTLTSLVHFYPTFEVELKNDAANVRSLSLAFTVFPLGARGASLSVVRGEAAGAEGWYAPALGIKYPASALHLVWEKQELPWIGGYLIVPGTGLTLKDVQTDFVAGTVKFRLGDRPYNLEVRSALPAHTNFEER